MDGTLLDSTATLELTGFFDQRAVGVDIETRWGTGQISDDEFWQTLLDICEHATDSEIDTVFSHANWLSGIAATFEDIRSRDEVAIVISQSPGFFVDRLRQWGAHETYGSDVVLGQPLAQNATLSPAAKVTITRSVLDRYSLTPDDCVAYGDSSSDVELFGWLKNTVAVNASSPAVADLAAVKYHGFDLYDAYALGRDLLNARSFT